ncbi:MAG TPA: hypothetical protein VGG75_21580 [Trebonia sp.]
MYEVKSGERSRLLYLSQIDVQLANFMRRRKSLMSELATRLLLESGVVVLDTYFVGSDEIYSDLQKNNRSWVKQGLRRGLIVPAFRKARVQTFEENWESSILPSGLLGIRGDMRGTIEKLDSAIVGRSTPRITWPEKVGVSFGELITSEFAREPKDTGPMGRRPGSPLEAEPGAPGKVP